MTARVFDGSPASEGIGLGTVRRVDWAVPMVPHRMVDPSSVPSELERFSSALDTVRHRLHELRDQAEDRLGAVESRIFDPQLLMLEDVEVVDPARQYIRELHLDAARAFDLRMMELQSLWRRMGSSMAMDRLNDVEDLHVRMLDALLGRPDPFRVDPGEGPLVLVAKNVTPSMTVQLDPEQVAGIVTEFGTRTSHWAILARSQHIPAVVGVSGIFGEAREGEEAIVDGRIGRIVLSPAERHRSVFQGRRDQIRVWEAEVESIASLPSVTADGHPVALRANLDLPVEAARARAHGAEGVGLLRTEFLVVGRDRMPGEDEQYEGYRQVAQAFHGHPVLVRLFDLGGDKFPAFLNMPAEQNPFLGWRAVRVLLDNPDLFRGQIRAALRATVHGDVRIMVPLVNDVYEIREVRRLIATEASRLQADGVAYNLGYKLGIMVETPAAALDAAELAQHCDFFSIGTNDLVQYTLAVDRGNARLSRLSNPFHPSVIRQIHQVSQVARAAGIELSVCGEMAASALGAFLLLGLEISTLSVAWPSLPELKKVIRQMRMDDARTAALTALEASTAGEVTRILGERLARSVDLEAYRGRWELQLPD